MTDTLTITKEEGRVTVLHLSGILNAATQKAFVEAANQVRTDGAHFLLVDISGITMLTSAGLQAIERIYRLFTPHEKIGEWEAAHPGEVFKSPHFKLGGASPQVYSILNIAGFLHHIPMYANLQEALDSFGK